MIHKILSYTDCIGVGTHVTQLLEAAMHHVRVLQTHQVNLEQAILRPLHIWGSA